jgi:outer membrane protein insertion porin family
MAGRVWAGCKVGCLFRSVMLGLFVLGLCGTAPSQVAETGQTAAADMPKTAPATEQLLSSYEGQNVTTIEIAGQPKQNVSQFAPLFVQHAGEPFSRQKVEQTITAIEKAGKFADIQLQVNPEADGVQVLLVLEPAVYFGLFRFPGAQRFNYSRLLQVSSYPPGAPFNQYDIQRDEQGLLTFFRQEGFFQVEIHPEVQVESGHAMANVLFHVNLKRQASFGAIEFTGLPASESEKLTKHLRSLLVRLRGAAIRTGKRYHRSTLTRATAYLQSKLQKEGRLGAQVKLAGAEYNAETNRADIHFDVDLGPVVHVQIEGARLWPWNRKSLLPIYQGVGIDGELVQEGEQALISHFQSKGFFDVKVSSQFRQQSTADAVTYQIDKGKKHKVVDVTLSGNSRLPASELRAHLAVEKAHFLSSGKYSQQLLRTSVGNLSAIYQSEGFSSVHITPKITTTQGNIKVLFEIDEGPRDIVKSLKIEGNNTLSQAKFAPKGLKLEPGHPYSGKLVQSDRASIVASYLELGYLTASFRETATVESKADPHSINVVYHIYEGPQVFTGDVLTLGRQRTQQRLIDGDIASIQPGKPLTETQLLSSESKLYDHTGVFDWAEVDPERQITTQTKENVLVKVHEAARNQITYGFGFEVINRGGSVPSGTVALPNLPPIGLPSTFTTSEKTFYGPRGTFQYTRNNLWGKGSSFSFTAFAGRLDQRGAAYFIDPTFLWSKWKTTASIFIESNQENPIFSSEEEQASYQFQRFIDKKRANTLFLRYSFGKTDLTRVEIPALVPTQDRDVRLSTVSANLTHDTRDNPLDAHKGMLDSVELDLTSKKLGAGVDFAKLIAQSAYYRQIFGKIVWANSIRVGLAQAYAGSFVPLSEAFFTGGGNTLRGFPLDGAGPQRQVPVCSSGSTTDCTMIQVPAGGNELLILNSELRIPLPIKKGLGLVTFYDGGNVFPNVGFHDFTSLYSNNVGLGLRYATPVGPVRVDLGRNLNPVPGISATQYFISIGQAF